MLPRSLLKLPMFVEHLCLRVESQPMNARHRVLLFNFYAAVAYSTAQTNLSD